VRRLAALVLAVSCFACGGGDDGGGSPDDDPVLRRGDVVTVSPACRDAFDAGHRREQSGMPTPDAFLPSIEVCSSLAEWSSAAREAGTRLNGQEPRFVHGVCTSAGDAVAQASPICQQARAGA
jgi:hypothetical protein